MQIRVGQLVAAAYMALMAGAAATLGAQTVDPMMGTWKVDVAKSTFKPGPGPKSATIVIEPAGTGIKNSVDRVNVDGSTTKWGFITQRDGKPVPVTGNLMWDTATMTMANPSAGTIEFRKGDQLVATSRVAVSADGKTMTRTTTGTNPKGQAIHSVIVLTKQ